MRVNVHPPPLLSSQLRVHPPCPARPRDIRPMTLAHPRIARRKVCVMYGSELPGRIGGILDEDGCTWADAKDTAGLHTPGRNQHSIWSAEP